MALVLAIAATTSAQIPQLSDPTTTDAQIKLYESWVAADPASINNQTLLAAAYLQKTRETNDFAYLDRAQKIVDRVLASHDDYQAKTQRVQIELVYHHFAAAAQYARELLTGAPRDAQLWGALGDALLETGDLAGARKAFAKMLELSPSLLSYNRVAYLRFIEGDAPGAIELMRKAIEAGSEIAEYRAWVNIELGHLHFKTGQLDPAAAAYQTALAEFPAAHAAHAGLGAVAAAHGQLAEAVAHVERAQAISPMVQYAGSLFDLYTALGEPAKARQQAQRVDLAAALDEASGEAANRTLALIYANEDRELTKALKIAQADFAIRQGVYTEDALAWVLYKNGRLEEARAAARHIAEVGTPDPLFFYHAGMIAHALGDQAEARANLERALALNPGFDIAQAVIARRTLAHLAGE